MSYEKYLQKQIPSKERLKIRDSCKPWVTVTLIVNKQESSRLTCKTLHLCKSCIIKKSGWSDAGY